MKKPLIITGTILSSLFVTTSALASTYEVQSGDTLYNISQKHNTSVQELKTLNKLTSNLIVPGQVIKIDDKQESYVVKAGDSLSEIAKEFHTTVDGLVKLNPEISNPNLIVVGQTIRLVEETPDVYTVQLGDTLFSISKAHNTTVDFLLALNPEITNENKIRVGQEVKVSGTVVDVSKANTTTKPATSQSSEVKQETTKKEVATTAPVKEKVETSKPAPTPAPAPAPKPQPKQESKPAPAPAPAATSASADSVISAGKNYLGAKYLYGASTSRTDAFDCSSFTYRAFKEGAGITLPRTSSAQASVGTPVSFGSLQKGDLVFFDTDHNGSINHVGIYVGNGQMINAATSKGVSYADINSSYWKPRMVKATRVL